MFEIRQHEHRARKDMLENPLVMARLKREAGLADDANVRIAFGGGHGGQIHRISEYNRPRSFWKCWKYLQNLMCTAEDMAKNYILFASEKISGADFSYLRGIKLLPTFES